MKNILTLLLFLVATTAFSQRLGHEHTDFIGGPGGVTFLTLVLPDSSGTGFTLTGYSKDTSANGIIPPNPTKVGQIFVHYDAAGNRGPVRLIPTFYGAGRMVRTPDGNVVCLSLDTTRVGDILIPTLPWQNLTACQTSMRKFLL